DVDRRRRKTHVPVHSLFYRAAGSQKIGVHHGSPGFKRTDFLRLYGSCHLFSPFQIVSRCCGYAAILGSTGSNGVRGEPNTPFQLFRGEHDGGKAGMLVTAVTSNDHGRDQLAAEFWGNLLILRYKALYSGKSACTAEQGLVPGEERLYRGTRPCTGERAL